MHTQVALSYYHSTEWNLSFPPLTHGRLCFSLLEAKEKSAKGLMREREQTQRLCWEPREPGPWQPELLMTLDTNPGPMWPWDSYYRRWISILLFRLLCMWSWSQTHPNWLNPQDEELPRGCGGNIVVPKEHRWLWPLSNTNATQNSNREKGSPAHETDKSKPDFRFRTQLSWQGHQKPLPYPLLSPASISSSAGPSHVTVKMPTASGEHSSNWQPQKERGASVLTVPAKNRSQWPIS